MSPIEICGIILTCSAAVLVLVFSADMITDMIDTIRGWERKDNDGRNNSAD